MARDRYKSSEARAIREAVVKAREIVRRFGDPNNGNYIDPWGTISESNTHVAITGHFEERPDASGNQHEFTNLKSMPLDLSRMFPPSGGLHVPDVPRDEQGFRTSS